MARRTKIEWCDATWNPVVGCSWHSRGCDNCYAHRIVRRFKKISPAHNGWDNEAHFLPEKLEEPKGWRKPQRVFVCSMGDLFHETMDYDDIAAVFGAMAECPQHTFHVLTKRPDRMVSWFEWIIDTAGFDATFRDIAKFYSNVWIGVSVEDQDTADYRIPWLLKTPQMNRFISCEPLLGRIDLLKDPDWLQVARLKSGALARSGWRSEIGWVIAGAETGSGARPCDLSWLRLIRNHCVLAGVPFFLKKVDAKGQRWLDFAMYEEYP